MTIHERLEKIDKLKQHKRKVDQLQQLDTDVKFVVKSIFQATYNHNVKFDMPEGSPPFTPNEKEDIEISKNHFHKAMIASMNRKQHQWKRERDYTKFLESISPKDAEIMIAMKDKKLTDVFPTFTRELCKEVYPEMKL